MGAVLLIDGQMSSQQQTVHCPAHMFFTECTVTVKYPFILALNSQIRQQQGPKVISLY